MQLNSKIMGRWTYRRNIPITLGIVNYQENAQTNPINHTIQVYLKTGGAIYYHVLRLLLKLHFKTSKYVSPSIPI